MKMTFQQNHEVSILTLKFVRVQQQLQLIVNYLQMCIDPAFHSGKLLNLTHTDIWFHLKLCFSPYMKLTI